MIDESVKLGDAIDWLRGQATRQGAHCPCCGRFSKIYRRSIHATMAGGLIACWRLNRREWFHMRTATRYAGGDHSKLRYWGLIEEGVERRSDGGRSGKWRITDKGEQFVLGQTRLPKHAVVYNGELLYLDDSKGTVDIRDCVMDPFTYDVLMAE